MAYQWDPGKAAINKRKHGIAFSDAVAVFEDEAAITILDEAEDAERFVTLGTDAFGRLLVIVFTWRGKDIRVISARKATGAERRAYETGGVG